MDGDHGLNLAHDHAVVLGLSRGLRVAYSGAAAATYADTYWQSYNTDWPSFTRKGGDCTNFVSQVLYAGGIAMGPGTCCRAKVVGWSPCQGPSRLELLSTSDEGRRMTGPHNGRGRPRAPLFLAFIGNVPMTSI